MGIKRLQGGNEVGEKTGEFIVLRLEREPGDGCARGSPPLGQQRRFAKTGGGREERERASHSLLEPLDELGAGHEPRAGTRRMQFGREPWIGRSRMRTPCT